MLDVVMGDEVLRLSGPSRDGLEEWCRRNNLPEPFPGYHRNPAGTNIEWTGALLWMAELADRFPQVARLHKERSWHELWEERRLLSERRSDVSDVEQAEEFFRMTAATWYAFLFHALNTCQQPAYN